MAISSLLDVTSSDSECPWSERSLSEPAKIKKGKTLKQKVSIEFKSMLQFSFAYLSFDYSINNQEHVFPLVSVALQVNFTNCLSIEQLTIFTSTKRGS